jgi:hypothetical protein
MAFKFDLIRDLKEIGVDDEGWVVLLYTTV